MTPEEEVAAYERGGAAPAPAATTALTPEQEVAQYEGASPQPQYVQPQVPNLPGFTPVVTRTGPETEMQGTTAPMDPRDVLAADLMGAPGAGGSGELASAVTDATGSAAAGAVAGAARFLTPMTPGETAGYAVAGPVMRGGANFLVKTFPNLLKYIPTALRAAAVRAVKADPAFFEQIPEGLSEQTMAKLVAAKAAAEGTMAANVESQVAGLTANEVAPRPGVPEFNMNPQPGMVGPRGAAMAVTKPAERLALPSPEQAGGRYPAPEIPGPRNPYRPANSPDTYWESPVEFVMGKEPGMVGPRGAAMKVQPKGPPPGRLALPSPEEAGGRYPDRNVLGPNGTIIDATFTPVETAAPKALADAGVVVTNSGPRRVLPEQLVSEMNRIKVAASAVPEGKPMLIKRIGGSMGFAQPQEALDRAGLKPFGDALIFGETQAERMAFWGERELATAMKASGVRPGSEEMALAADFLELKVTPEILAKAQAEGVNVEASKKLAESVRPILDAYGNMAALPQQRWIPGYMPHMWEHPVDAKMGSSAEALALRMRYERLGTRSAFLEKHRTGAEGYMRGLDEILPVYFRSVSRDVFLDRPVRELSGRLKSIPMPTDTRQFAERLLMDMVKPPATGGVEQSLGAFAGGITNFAERALTMAKAKGVPGLNGAIANIGEFNNLPSPQKFSHGLRVFKSLNAVKFLGLNLSTPTNIMIDVVPAFAEIGPKWTAEGFAQAGMVVSGKGTRTIGKNVVTPAQLRSVWEVSGLPAISSGRMTHMETGARAVKGAYERYMLSLVQGADIATKMASYFGARAKFLAEHPGDLFGANMYGLNVVQRAQPLFLKSTTPAALRSPLARVGLQFTQPAVKVGSQQLRMLADIRKDPKQLALYLGAVAALTGAGYAAGVPMYRQFSPVVIDDKGRIQFGYWKPGATAAGTLAAGSIVGGEGGKRAMIEGATELATTPLPMRNLKNIATATGAVDPKSMLGKILKMRKLPRTIEGKIREAMGFAANEKPPVMRGY